MIWRSKKLGHPSAETSETASQINQLLIELTITQAHENGYHTFVYTVLWQTADTSSRGSVSAAPSGGSELGVHTWAYTRTQRPASLLQTHPETHGSPLSTCGAWAALDSLTALRWPAASGDAHQTHDRTPDNAQEVQTTKRATSWSARRSGPRDQMTPHATGGTLTVISAAPLHSSSSIGHGILEKLQHTSQDRQIPIDERANVLDGG